jgi:diguanylate cyclase (GGDEF)-like protein
VCLLPETDAAGAMIVANRIGEKIRNSEFRVRGSTRLRITVSVGVRSVSAVYPGCGVDDLIADADAALYLAKDAGRDRVVEWREEVVARD